MDEFVTTLINGLAKSPTELTDKNKKKIQEYLPVPSDFDILWADINSFGGYPSGIVLTNKGIVSKAPRPTIYEKKIAEKNERVYQIPYQVILWEYFEPSNFEYEKRKDGNCFAIKREGILVTIFKDKSLLTFFKKYEAKLRADEELVDSLIQSSVFSEVGTINMEATSFNAAYGENQTKTGHGIYAEEAGAVLDKLNG